MRIETEHLYLRPFIPSDLDDYHTQIYGDPDVMTYIAGRMTRSRERTNDVLEFAFRHGKTYGYSLWAVIERVTDQFIGHCGLVHPNDAPEVELVCALGKAYQAQGLGPEAAVAALRYGFETAGLETILGLAYPENEPSQRGMRKIGMQYMGMTDRFYNAALVCYQINHADWQPTPAPYRLIL